MAVKTPKVIVSLTSHTKERLSQVPYFLFHSIIKHKFDYVKTVLTLAQEDVNNMPRELQLMINSGLIELIVADQDLKCNLKYFYTMKKYRDLPIITIDDDSIYPSTMIPDLLKLHETNPSVILARSARVISYGKSYKHWKEVNIGVEKTNFDMSLVNQVRSDLSPEGYGGVLYPANILNITDDLIHEMTDFFRADDIFLTVIEQRKRLNAMVPFYNYNKLEKCTRPAFSICTRPDNIQMIDDLIRRYL